VLQTSANLQLIERVLIMIPRFGAIAVFVLGTSMATSMSVRALETKCGNGKVVASEDKVYWYAEGESSGAKVYLPPNNFHTVVGLASCGTGIVTAFRDTRHGFDWAYYSPNCEHAGGGGKTENVYSRKNHKIVSLARHPDKPGILATFRDNRNGKETSYYSPDCRNIGGGENTVSH
jgi:hypothetical protein